MEVRFENGLMGRAAYNLGALDWQWEPAAKAQFMTPRVDVLEDHDKYYFHFELPGLSNESIDARVEDGKLLVSADREQPQRPEGTVVRVAECSYGKIHRVFELPKDARLDQIEASYKNGMLRVTVEKKPESKPTKILVS